MLSMSRVSVGRYRMPSELSDDSMGMFAIVSAGGCRPPAPLARSGAAAHALRGHRVGARAHGHGRCGRAARAARAVAVGTVYRTGMNDAARVFAVLGEVVRRHGLASLVPTLVACEELARADAPLDVAVLGQFKSGKSSLLNALVGEDLLPVGVVPVTAVITRLRGESAAAGKHGTLRMAVARLDGSVIEAPASAVAEYVSEAGNPNNLKGVAAVDIVAPMLAGLPGLRLVDTPGLGSVHAHNTQSTMAWLPSVALALVAISVERPLSEEDRRLIETLRPLAARVVVVLTKTDLVTDAELEQVRGFVAREIRETLGLPAGAEPVIVPFSVRKECERHVARLRDGLLAPIARNAGIERAAALNHKLTHLTRAVCEYLQVALRAAERTQEQREGLKAAVFSEAVRESVIRDELSLTLQRLVGATRAAFEAQLKPTQAGLADLLVLRAVEELANWRGNLAAQRQRFEDWLHAELLRELSAVSESLAPLARQLVEQAQERFARLVEAFRDRLSRNMDAALGIALSPVHWNTTPAHVTTPPISIGKVFDIHIDLLWFLIPMRLLHGLFHGHFRRRIPWEVEKNLSRLAADWSEATSAAIGVLHAKSLEWVHAELATLASALARQPADVADIRHALAQVDAAAAP
jgi:GTPase Era involved in 16S rRNA processing